MVVLVLVLVLVLLLLLLLLSDVLGSSEYAMLDVCELQASGVDFSS